VEEKLPGVKIVTCQGISTAADKATCSQEQSIRDYCQDNDKVLYDFEDIETTIQMEPILETIPE
jgi:hypothetical protein